MLGKLLELYTHTGFVVEENDGKLLRKLRALSSAITRAFEWKVTRSD